MSRTTGGWFDHDVRPTSLWARAGIVWALLTLLCFVPGVVCSALGLSSLAGLAAIGAIGGALSTVAGGSRLGIEVSIGVGVASGLALLCTGNPWLALLLFLALGLLVGIRGMAGSWPSLIYVPMAAGFALGEDPTLNANPMVNGLIAAIALAGSGLLATLVAWFTSKRMPPRTATPISRTRGITYGVALGILLGAAAFAMDALSLDHTGSWIILTIVIVLQPYVQDAWRKSLERAAGTIIGVLIAMLIGIAVSLPTIIYVIGIIAMFLAIVAQLDRKPYWVFAIPLTVGIVCFVSAGRHVIDTAEQRLIATLIGAAAALLVTLIVGPVSRRKARQAGIDHY